MMSSGSTVLRFDFDIFSMAPISTASPVAIKVARRASPSALDFHFRRRRPFAVRPAIGLVHDHALGEQAGERLFESDMAGRLHRAGEEAAVEQMQDRVLDAADILVDRHPGIDHRPVGRRTVDPRIGEALEIPRRVDERVHGVGFAPRRSAALRAGDVSSRSDDGRADCRAGRTSRLPAASPADPFPAPARRRISRNG